MRMIIYLNAYQLLIINYIGIMHHMYCWLHNWLNNYKVLKNQYKIVKIGIAKRAQNASTLEIYVNIQTTYHL